MMINKFINLNKSQWGPRCDEDQVGTDTSIEPIGLDGSADANLVPNTEPVTCTDTAPDNILPVQGPFCESKPEPEPEPAPKTVRSTVREPLLDARGWKLRRVPFCGIKRRLLCRC